VQTIVFQHFDSELSGEDKKLKFNQWRKLILWYRWVFLIFLNYKLLRIHFGMIFSKRKFNNILLAILGKNGDDAIVNLSVFLIAKHGLN
jgi:hypothetical protein